MSDVHAQKLKSFVRDEERSSMYGLLACICVAVCTVQGERGVRHWLARYASLLEEKREERTQALVAKMLATKTQVLSALPEEAAYPDERLLLEIALKAADDGDLRAAAGSLDAAARMLRERISRAGR